MHYAPEFIDDCPLNPEPTVSQLAALERARRTGKVTNPKWYRNPAANVTPRTAFVPGQPPKYPHRLFTTISNEAHRAFVFDQFLRRYPGIDSDPSEYVKAFDEASKLRPVPIVWIKPNMGSYA